MAQVEWWCLVCFAIYCGGSIVAGFLGGCVLTAASSLAFASSNLALRTSTSIVPSIQTTLAWSSGRSPDSLTPSGPLSQLLGSRTLQWSMHGNGVS